VGVDFVGFGLKGVYKNLKEENPGLG